MYDNWQQLEDSIIDCRKCKLCINNKNNNIKLGYGNKNADIMFIGEILKEDEDLSDFPFLGKPGQLMDKAFDGIGINKENVYFANIVKCMPTVNTILQENEIMACLDYLRNQVLLVKPKIIVLLGNIAVKNILGKDLEIIFTRGKWIERKNIFYMSTWEPSLLIKDANKKIEFWKDLKLVKQKAEMEELSI